MTQFIPTGWRIEVTSWENDGDYYNTKILEGLNEDVARFYIELAHLFGDSGIEAANACDNAEVEWDKLIPAFKAIIAKYPSALSKIWQQPDEAEIAESLSDDQIEDSIGDVAYNILGASEFYVFRVFESYRAYYFPDPIKSIDLMKFDRKTLKAK